MYLFEISSSAPRLVLSTVIESQRSRHLTQIKGPYASVDRQKKQSEAAASHELQVFTVRNILKFAKLRFYNQVINRSLLLGCSVSSVVQNSRPLFPSGRVQFGDLYQPTY